MHCLKQLEDQQRRKIQFKDKAEKITTMLMSMLFMRTYCTSASWTGIYNNIGFILNTIRIQG